MLCSCTCLHVSCVWLVSAAHSGATLAISSLLQAALHCSALLAWLGSWTSSGALQLPRHLQAPCRRGVRGAALESCCSMCAATPRGPQTKQGKSMSIVVGSAKQLANVTTCLSVHAGVARAEAARNRILLLHPKDLADMMDALDQHMLPSMFNTVI